MPGWNPSDFRKSYLAEKVRLSQQNGDQQAVKNSSLFWISGLVVTAFFSGLGTYKWIDTRIKEKVGEELTSLANRDWLKAFGPPQFSAAREPGAKASLTLLT
jgi:hypothetical protein